MTINNGPLAFASPLLAPIGTTLVQVICPVADEVLENPTDELIEAVGLLFQEAAMQAIREWEPYEESNNDDDDHPDGETGDSVFRGEY